jgi:hypothetical protein
VQFRRVDWVGRALATHSRELSVSTAEVCSSPSLQSRGYTAHVQQQTGPGKHLAHETGSTSRVTGVPHLQLPYLQYTLLHHPTSVSTLRTARRRPSP